MPTSFDAQYTNMLKQCLPTTFLATILDARKGQRQENDALYRFDHTTYEMSGKNR
jgi:hypothetical protein